MKFFLFASALSLMGSCTTKTYTKKAVPQQQDIVLKDSLLIKRYANTITASELNQHVYHLASDDLQGRRTGELGFDKASQFLKDYYSNQDIASPLGNSNYYQQIPDTYFQDKAKQSQNVIAYIKGSTYPDQTIIISGHLDHLGATNTSIYKGADDNGSGTAAIMEIAQAFKQAKDNGVGPKRSIVFLHLTGEEEGLYGSNYYTQYPVFDLKKTVANLNIDMVGRVDPKHQNSPNYIYLIGANRLSSELHNISEAANRTFTNLELDYTYNSEDDPNRYYYRSDHYNFAKNGIPAIFYFNGTHEDYHKPTDTPDKINYPLLEKRTKLIFSTAWYLANSKKRLSKKNQ